MSGKLKLRQSAAIQFTAAYLALTATSAWADGFDAAYGSITSGDLAKHIEILASDAFEGREPGTNGERLTVDYLTRSFSQVGAKPGYGNSYAQDVPLVEMKKIDAGQMVLSLNGKPRGLTAWEEYAIFAGGARHEVNFAEVPLVFAGFGISAQEEGWDDYAGVDVRGKIVVLLRGEPAAPGDPAGFFQGRQLTRHGIQPTKYETAAAHGARGVIMVHTDQSAGYPWSVISSGGVSSTQHFIDDGASTPKLDVVIHVPEKTARQILQESGMALDAQVQKANQRGFRATPMQHRLTASYRSVRRSIQSQNVVAQIRGSAAPNECVIYTAHWDHLGRNAQLTGDQIFNGAVDNATGTAALLELAQAFAKLNAPPRRSIIFIATTAEEKGLLGAEYHASHPLCPLAETAAVLNLDALFPFGPHDAMTVPGLGASQVEDVMAKAAARLGRVLQSDSEPRAGAYYRSDHYPFAKRGVPAIFAVGNPRDTGALNPNDPVVARFIDYITNKYHKVTDAYDARTWDLRGVEGDVRVYFETGLTIANDAAFPQWKPGNEFKPIRDAMRAGR